MWVGSYLVTFEGKGIHYATYSPDDWEPGEWSANYWWVPAYPFVLIPKQTDGDFYLYSKGRYYKAIAKPDEVLQMKEVEADWTT